MSWFRDNRFLGAFVLLGGVAILGSLVFLWFARSGFNEAKAELDQNAAELNRLQQLSPFPSEANLRTMKSQADDYASSLNKAKEELQRHVLPVVPMAPNEFQSRLRQTAISVGEKARGNHVRLPDNFYLGFDEFAASLPDTAAAPVLGQQLAQAELLVNLLIDARVESVTAFRRVANSVAATATATPSPTATAAPKKPGAPVEPQVIERSVIETSFISSPSAARRALNQITTAPQQFYVLRTLHVLNEKEKGPPREGASSSAAGSGFGAPATPSASPNAALTFIVGNERLQTTARVEMVRFAF